jgi:hypothetical protein
MSVRIEVPKDVWPYGPPTVLLEPDIRTLLKEIPSMRYGLIGGMYPAVYWDTPLARFAVIPVFVINTLSGFPPRYIEYHSPRPMALVVFDVVVDDRWYRVIGEPCLVPALREWIYVRIPLTAIREEFGKIYIRPEMASYLTEFYTGVHSIYIETQDLLEGKADPLAERNILRCFFKSLVSPYSVLRQIEEPQLVRKMEEHIASTTKIPLDRIMRSEETGFCEAYSSDYYYKVILPHMSLTYERILSNEESYLQEFLFAQLVNYYVNMYRDLLSIRDLCEEGGNKPYEETLKGNFLSEEVFTYLYTGRLRLSAHPLYQKIYVRKFRNMVDPYLPRVGIRKDYLKRELANPESSLVKAIESYAEDVAKEVFIDYLRVPAQKVSVFIPYIKKRFLTSTVEALNRLPSIILIDELEDSLLGVYTGVIDSCIRDRLIREEIIPRILELYDKPLHVLSELYTKYDDYVAYFVHEAVQAFIDDYKLNAWEAIRAKFGLRGVEIKPQKLGAKGG